MIVAYTFPLILFVLYLAGMGWARVFIQRARWPAGCGWALSLLFGTLAVMLPAFGLVRFLGPVRQWAMVETIACVSISLVLWRLCARGPNGTVLQSWRRMIPVVVIGLLVIAPAMVGGPQFRAFRANHSDANNFIALAESAGRADWTLIRRAGQPDRSPESEAELARQSPTGLFTARFTHYPIRMNSSLFLAWMSAVTQLPVHEIYYVGSLVFVYLSALVVFILGGLLGIQRKLRSWVAAAIALGFSSYVSLETDTISQVQVLPFQICYLMAMAAGARSDFARRRRPAFVLAASSLTGVALFYPESLGYPAATMAAFAIVLAVVRPSRLLSYVGNQIALAITLVVVLSVTLQVDYIYQYLAYLARFTAGGVGVASVLINALKAHGIPCLTGYFSNPALAASSYAALLPAIGWITGIVGVGFVSGALLGACKHARQAPWRLLLPTMASCGIAIAAILGWMHADYLAGKFLAWALPFQLLLIGSEWWRHPHTRIRDVLVAAKLGYLGILAAFVGIAVDLASRDLSLLTSQTKAASFDLSPITHALKPYPQARIHVDVPPCDNWPFALHVIRTFQDLNVEYVSGYVYDNEATVPPRKFATSNAPAADFSVASKHCPSGLEAQPGAIAIAETSDLRLFKLRK